MLDGLRKRSATSSSEQDRGDPSTAPSPALEQLLSLARCYACDSYDERARNKFMLRRRILGAVLVATGLLFAFVLSEYLRRGAVLLGFLLIAGGGRYFMIPNIDEIVSTEGIRPTAPPRA